MFNEHTNGLEVFKPFRKLPELLDHTIETVTNMGDRDSLEP